MFGFFKKKKDEYEQKLQNFFKPAPQTRTRDVVRELASTVTTPQRKVRKATKAVATGMNNLFNPNTAKAKKAQAYRASLPSMTKQQAKASLFNNTQKSHPLNRESQVQVPLVQAYKQRSIKPLFDKKLIASNIKANVSDPYNAMGGGMSNRLSKFTGRIVNKAMQKGVSRKGIESIVKRTTQRAVSQKPIQRVLPHRKTPGQVPVQSSRGISSAENIPKNQTYKRFNNTPKIAQSQRMSTEALVKKQGSTIADDEVRAFREQQLLGKEAIDETIMRKRGIVTDKEAVERAKNYQMTIDQVANAPKGKIYNKEELTAVSQVVQQQRESVQSLRKLLDGGGRSQSGEERKLIADLGSDYTKLSEEELIGKAVEEATLKLKKAEMALLAAKSEAGRALQGSKQSIDAVDSRMRVVFGHLKKKTAIERQAILERLAKEPIEDEKNFIKLLDDINESDGFDKFAEWATATKLYNPTTHIVNFGSNTLRQLTDVAITGVTNPKTFKADMMGATVGLQSGLKNALRALTDEGYARTLSKYIEEGGQSPAIKGTAGKVIRSSFRALGAGDEIFRGIAYQRSLYRQASKQAKGNTKEMEGLLSHPTFKMMDEAKKQADRMTFQEEMGEITKQINKFRTPASYKSKAGKTVGLTARLFVPFLKTPTNLFKQAADFSPIGLLKNKKQILKGLKKGASEVEKEATKRALGEATVGSAFIAYTMSLVSDGNITGGAPKSQKERNQFYAEGKIPYSVKIGDKWVQYNRIDPLSTVIGLMADVGNADMEGMSIGAKASEISNIMAHNLSDKTYTKGMGDLLTLMTGESWERETILESQFVSSFVPSISGSVARSVDTIVRDTDGVADKFKSQIPFASKTLPAKRNVVGEEIDRQKDKKTWIGKATNQFLNPIKTSKESDNPVIQEIGSLNHALSIPKDSFTTNGKEYKMTPEEYEQYSADIGHRINEEVGAFIQSDEYQNLSNEEKVEEIDKMRGDIMADVKSDFVRNNAEKVGDPYYELKKSLDNADDEKRQAIIDSMPVSEQKKFKTYLNKEVKTEAKSKGNIAQDYRHSKVKTRQTKLFNDKMNKLKEMDEWKNASGDDREKIVKEFSTKSKHHAVAQMVQENSQGMNDEGLKQYLGDLKKAGILNKTIFELYMAQYKN